MSTVIESKLTDNELAFLRKLTEGKNWRLRDGKPTPAIASLVTRGYCRTSPERLGPLGIYTGEVCIDITEAGRAAIAA
ncbi:hypothetical protein [Oleiharenicola sp. Vm1]|uniref:hypothetical protein n=1 Tax=Oleiharenicola sp. Vm1 TaxID=3398393 RepID=UPI0039F55D58